MNLRFPFFPNPILRWKGVMEVFRDNLSNFSNFSFLFFSFFFFFFNRKIDRVRNDSKDVAELNCSLAVCDSS